MEIAAFLSQVSAVETDLLRDRQTVVTNMENGLHAAAILLLLSPDSVPERSDRITWEPALDYQPGEAGPRIGAVLIREARFPLLLKGRHFFDFAADRLGCLRAIKQWVLGLRPRRSDPLFVPGRSPFSGAEAGFEDLRVAIADQPGVKALPGAAGAGLALEFARRYRSDFEDVFWASKMGGIARQAGLFLEGPEDHDIRRMTEYCAARRLLIVLQGAPAHWRPRAKSSLLIVGRAETTAAPRLPLMERKLLAALSACSDDGVVPSFAAALAGLHEDVAWRAMGSLLERGLVELFNQVGPRYRATSRMETDLAARHAELACAEADPGELRHAFDWALENDWELAVRLGNRAFAVLKEYSRADAYAAMERLRAAAIARNDGRVEQQCSWELGWILEAWGRTVDSQRLFERSRALSSDQLAFDFG